jgi:hypothetical protein
VVERNGSGGVVVEEEGERGVGGGGEGSDINGQC